MYTQVVWDTYQTFRFTLKLQALNYWIFRALAATRGNSNHSWELNEWRSNHRVSVFSCQGFHCSINITNISTRGRQEPCDNAAILPAIYYSLLDYDNAFDLNSSQRGRAWMIILCQCGTWCVCAPGLGKARTDNMWTLLLISLKRKQGARFLFLLLFFSTSFLMNDSKHQFTAGKTWQCTRASLLLEQLWDFVLIQGKSATGSELPGKSCVVPWVNFCWQLFFKSAFT